MADNENANSITVIPVDEQVTTKDIEPHHIENMVYVIRNKQVMVDSDLALLYQVETKALNRAVKRNTKRFPEDFCFQLTVEDYENLPTILGHPLRMQGKSVLESI